MDEHGITRAASTHHLERFKSTGLLLIPLFLLGDQKDLRRSEDFDVAVVHKSSTLYLINSIPSHVYIISSSQRHVTSEQALVALISLD